MNQKPEILNFALSSVLLISLCGFALPSSVADETYHENPGTAGNGNYTIGPEYTVDPDLTDRGNPKGKYFEL